MYNFSDIKSTRSLLDYANLIKQQNLATVDVLLASTFLPLSPFSLPISLPKLVILIILRESLKDEVAFLQGGSKEIDIKEIKGILL